MEQIYNTTACLKYVDTLPTLLASNPPEARRIFSGLVPHVKKSAPLRAYIEAKPERVKAMLTAAANADAAAITGTSMVREIRDILPTAKAFNL